MFVQASLLNHMSRQCWNSRSSRPWRHYPKNRFESTNDVCDSDFDTFPLEGVVKFITLPWETFRDNHKLIGSIPLSHRSAQTETVRWSGIIKYFLSKVWIYDNNSCHQSSAWMDSSPVTWNCMSASEPWKKISELDVQCTRFIVDTFRKRI